MVADMAGVSTATASRVLTNSGSVSDALRRKVLDAVRETGYVPNAAASALAKGRSQRSGGLVHNAVAFAVATTDQTSFRQNWDEIYEGVLEAADELGINVSVCMIRRAEIEQGILPPALTRIQVDGILAGFSRISGVHLMPRLAPTVLVGSEPPMPMEAPVVEADHEKGVSHLVGHIAELGHERAEFVLYDWSHSPYRRRAEAFERAASACGLRYEVTPKIQGRIEEYARGLAGRPASVRPTALVVCSDGVAVRVMQALIAEGVRVPEDLSLVGFDGHFWGSLTAAPLTTWRVHWHEMGRAALKVLLELLAHGSAPTRTQVGGELVVRGSSCPPPDGVEVTAGQVDERTAGQEEGSHVA